MVPQREEPPTLISTDSKQSRWLGRPENWQKLLKTHPIPTTPIQSFFHSPRLCRNPPSWFQWIWSPHMWVDSFCFDSIQYINVHFKLKTSKPVVVPSSQPISLNDYDDIHFEMDGFTAQYNTVESTTVMSDIDESDTEGNCFGITYLYNSF